MNTHLYLSAGVALAAVLLGAPAEAQSLATVSVATSTLGASVTTQILGMNLANWYDQTTPGMATALKGAGIKAARWPGGSAADTFDWQTGTDCAGGYVNPNSSFTTFEADVVKPAGLDLAVTLNYGSNATCNGGGTPGEAAAWVTYAKSHNDPVSHWTIGNEVYGWWEYDLHTPAHDAATYANAVATGFYPQIKAANAAAQVGVVVEPNWQPAWDPIVLAQAKYDFVELHYYAQQPYQENDTYLTTQAPQAFAAQIAALKADLAAAGHPNTPIYLGELGSVSSDPGKQTSSITQALYAGQVLGEMMNAGIARATWWLGFGGCADSSSGNFSASIYGWQNFGGYMSFSDGTPEYGCTNATKVATGTDLPTARAFQLFGQVLQNGAHALSVTLGGNSANLRSYALTQAGGYALVLFNLNENATLPVSIAVQGLASASSLQEAIYDRAIYDQSEHNVWAAPASGRAGATALPFALTLQPWSMTVLTIKK